MKGVQGGSGGGGREMMTPVQVGDLNLLCDSTLAASARTGQSASIIMITKFTHFLSFVAVIGLISPAASQDSTKNPAVSPLFNGKDLTGWHADIPAADKNEDLEPSFTARDGHLVSLGKPRGHLITDKSFSNYKLVVEYRFPGKPGNCGVLVHSSTPRVLNNMFPSSIEVQMNSGHAGDFWCIGENIEVPEMEKRRPRGKDQKWGSTLR